MSEFECSVCSGGCRAFDYNGEKPIQCPYGRDGAEWEVKEAPSE